LTLGQSVSTSAEKLLQAVVEKSPHQPVRGLACLALGRYLKHKFLGSPGIAKLDAAVSALVEGVENNRTAK
jgi:hypothetical protein